MKYGVIHGKNFKLSFMLAKSRSISPSQTIEKWPTVVVLARLFEEVCRFSSGNWHRKLISYSHLLKQNIYFVLSYS